MKTEKRKHKREKNKKKRDDLTEREGERERGGKLPTHKTNTLGGRN